MIAYRRSIRGNCVNSATQLLILTYHASSERSEKLLFVLSFLFSSVEFWRYIVYDSSAILCSSFLCCCVCCIVFLCFLQRRKNNEEFFCFTSAQSVVVSFNFVPAMVMNCVHNAFCCAIPLAAKRCFHSHCLRAFSIVVLSTCTMRCITFE